MKDRQRASSTNSHSVSSSSSSSINVELCMLSFAANRKPCDTANCSKQHDASLGVMTMDEMIIKLRQSGHTFDRQKWIQSMSMSSSSSSSSSSSAKRSGGQRHQTSSPRVAPKKPICYIHFAAGKSCVHGSRCPMAHDVSQSSEQNYKVVLKSLQQRRMFLDFDKWNKTKPPNTEVAVVSDTVTYTADPRGGLFWGREDAVAVASTGQECELSGETSSSSSNNSSGSSNSNNNWLPLVTQTENNDYDIAASASTVAMAMDVTSSAAASSNPYTSSSSSSSYNQYHQIQVAPRNLQNKSLKNLCVDYFSKFSSCSFGDNCIFGHDVFYGLESRYDMTRLLASMHPPRYINENLWPS